MRKPAAFSARSADSRPGPGPRTRISRLRSPYCCASSPTRLAAVCAANGVLLREPRKPEPPEVAQHRVLPRRSVMVTMVLLNEARMCAMPSLTVRRAFRRGRAAALFCCCLGAATPYLRIGRRGPLRVRALVRVRWPRSGRLRRWRMPR